MRRDLTRREWAAALGASAAASRAQTPPSEDALAQARREVAAALARLQEFKLPAGTEPAVVFRP